MKVDIRGGYIPIRTIKSQEEWEKIIEAFVSLGAQEWEGRKESVGSDYSDEWSYWSYVGVNECNETMHHNYVDSFSEDTSLSKEITKEYLFSLCDQPPYSADQYTSLPQEALTVIEALLDYIDGLPKDVESSSCGVDRDWVEGVICRLKNKE